MKHDILYAYHNDTVVLHCRWCGVSSSQHTADESLPDNPHVKGFLAKHPNNCTNKG